MSEKAKIKSTGDLRRFIADAMSEVKNGELDLDKASRITKLAAQINESFYSEIKVAKVLAEAGKAISDLGMLPIDKA